MIDKSRHTDPVDDCLAVLESEQIGLLVIIVEIVGFLVREVRPNIFNDERIFFDGLSSVTTAGVDGRLSDDEAHGCSFQAS